MTRALVLCAAAVAALAGSTPAAAYPDAKVEAKITPNFGALLSPPVSHPAKRHHGRWYPPGPAGYPGPPRGPGGKPRPGKPPYLFSVLTVDCSAPKAGPTPINDALDQLQPGGSLYIRGACNETLWLTQPVTLAGETSSAFGPPGARPSITAPAGQPCIALADGVRRVEIRGLQLVSDKGGRAACIEAENAEVAVVDTEIRYTGDDVAVWIGGGRLLLRNGRIEAQNADTALLVDGAVITAERASIVTGGVGVDLTLGGQGTSELTELRLQGPGLGVPGARRSTGLLLRGGRNAPRLNIRGGGTEGFTTGLWFDNGSVADVSGVSVRRSYTAVVIDGGDVTITGSRLGARDTVVQVAAGRAHIDGNFLHGYVTRAVAVAPGALFSGRNKLRPRLGCRGDELREDCLPLGLATPDLRDDDNGWGPAPVKKNPKPPRGGWQ